MKKFLRRAASLLLAAFFVFFCALLPSSRGYALYNDAKYDSYNNMNGTSGTHAQYIVPNLYRQDASYTNVKTFPLVVSGSVEYFPLDIFALYSYLDVVYSKMAYGFYINNTNNGHYVAFDVENGATTTYDLQSADLEAKIFYQTYYVPAREVCEILGMRFESYDDPEGGIRAARISDSRAKYTLTELVDIYSPKKNTPETDDNSQKPGPKNPDTSEQQEPDNTTQPPKQAEEDPYLKVGTRNLYITVENAPNANTDRIISALDRHGKKAIFFLEGEAIKTYPETARKIITSGHAVGIYFKVTGEEGELLGAEDIISSIDAANDALWLVAKRKTRFVRAESGYADGLKEEELAEELKKAGYVSYDYSLSAGDASGGAQRAYSSLIESIVGSRPSQQRTLFLRFGSYSASASVIESLLEFSEKYSQIKIMSTDEYTEPPSFIAAD